MGRARNDKCDLTSHDAKFEKSRNDKCDLTSHGAKFEKARNDKCDLTSHDTELEKALFRLLQTFMGRVIDTND